MLAVRLHPDRQVRLHDEPEPEPGPGDAMVRVTSVGLCGSDRHWVVDGGTGDALLDRPIILGHEFGGTVETGRFRGRLVAVDPAMTCGRCGWCQSGASNLCPEVRFAGDGRTDGALRELVAWPEHSLYPLSERTEPGDAALIEPLSVAIHSINLAGGVAGATVAVIGCGPIGLMLVALAHASGAATIVATDPLPHRLEAARELGARTLAADAEGAGGLAPAEVAGPRVDVAFDAAGDASATGAAVGWARPGGQVILVGIPPDDRVTFRAWIARRKGLTLKFVRRAPNDSFRRAVETIDDVGSVLKGFVTLRTSLGEAPRAFDALVQRSGIKVVVEPQGAR
jgi:L-iditol 2-dehydrogenase